MGDAQEIINVVALSTSLRAAADYLKMPWKECRETYLAGLAEGLKPTVKRTGASKKAIINKGLNGPFVVVWFTDAHNQPGMALERFTWLGKFVNELAPHALVDGGDFDDLHSLCSHEKNESWKGKFKPAFLDDLAASESARAEINRHIAVPVEKYHLLGNHEDRLFQFEDRVPEIFGMMQHAYLEIQARHGWEVLRFREYLTLHGVDFTHIPMNGMNKAMGGKRCAINVAAQSLHDCCFGHTHQYAYWEEAKLGPSRSAVAINGGCFMPDGYVPAYAKGGQKAPWYGLHVLKIEGGRIAEHTPVTMRELARRYG